LSHKNSPVERQLVKLIETFPFPPEVTQGWIAQIHEQGMSEELAEQIHNKLAEPVDGQPLPNRARLLVELAAQIKRWRMAEGARKFGR
jgi:hypothetical protein